MPKSAQTAVVRGGDKVWVGCQVKWRDYCGRAHLGCVVDITRYGSMGTDLRVLLLGDEAGFYKHIGAKQVVRHLEGTPLERGL